MQPEVLANTNKTSELQAPELANFMDYRLFLSAYYNFRRDQTKNALRPYNYAVFSAAADIKSPNYLKMIIDGRRNLSEDMIGKFAKAVGLSKEQTEEFKLLVLFTQTSDPAQRNIYLRHLNESRVQQKLKSGEIDRKTWDKVPNWVAWILYTMIDQKGVDFDPETLRGLLRGKASVDEIQTALNSLFVSGELVKDPITGEVKKAHALMDSADEVPVALVRKLQAQLMYLGLESLFHDAPTEREFGSLTLSLTKPEFEELKFQLRKMRKSIHKDNAIHRMNSKGEKVYQLNIQLFPLTDSAQNEAKLDH